MSEDAEKYEVTDGVGSGVQRANRRTFVIDGLTLYAVSQGTHRYILARSSEDAAKIAKLAYPFGVGLGFPKKHPGAGTPVAKQVDCVAYEAGISHPKDIAEAARCGDVNYEMTTL